MLRGNILLGIFYGCIFCIIYRMATEWMETVKRVMKENPTLSFKDVLKTAKREYNKAKPKAKATRKASKTSQRKPTRKARKARKE